MLLHPFKQITSFLVFISLLQITSSAEGDSTLYQWKPRLGLEFRSQKAIQAQMALGKKKKFLVLIQGYTMGITLVALSATLSEGQSRDKSLNPSSAFFYTNVYRWALRYMAMLPRFLGAHDQNIAETHKVWKKRFEFMDQMVPDWMQKALFFVGDWDKFKKDQEKFRKYSESAFSKHYRYPTRSFDNFASEETNETVSESQSNSS